MRRGDLVLAARAEHPAQQAGEAGVVVRDEHTLDRSPDPDVGRLFQRHLDGFRVESADDLEEASARALELKASAIVADLDGPTGEDTGGVPIVRCPLPDRRQLVGRLGVAGYLVKPISREVLLETIARVAGAAERVLVADDDARFARLLTRMLAASDRDEIATAHNGEEALAKMRASPPDLLLLDMAMPVLDGVGVLAQMAGEPALQHTKVIVVSAHAEGERAVPLGTEVRIGKPEGFQLAEMIEVIGAAVSRLAPVRAHLTATAPAPPAAPPG